MKIEIEFEEVERLRGKIETLQLELGEKEEKLKSYSPESIDRQIKNTANQMFHAVMHRIAKDNGMEYQPGGYSFHDMERNLSRSWWNSEELNITISIEIAKAWRRLFVLFGYRHKSEENKVEEYDFGFEIK